MPVSLTETDRRLLVLLRANARLSVSSLAASLNVARATVTSRLTRLEKSGIILGYSVRVVDGCCMERVQAIMLLRVQGKAANAALRHLKGFPEITSLHVTNGRWDIVLNVAASDLTELEQTLRKIRTIDGVLHTETSILLSHQK